MMITADGAMEVWKKWADLGTEIIILQQECAGDWSPVRRIIAAAEEILLLEGENLRALLEKSRKCLYPLGDPLLIDFGAHRWLAQEPEPAYSDWLHWIVRQLPTPELMFRMFRKNASWTRMSVSNPTPRRRPAK